MDLASKCYFITDTLARSYNPETAGVTGFLVDLDGTVYRPDGLIRGAKEFHEWLVETGARQRA